MKLLILIILVALIAFLFMPSQQHRENIVKHVTFADLRHERLTDDTGRVISEHYVSI